MCFSHNYLTSNYPLLRKGSFSLVFKEIYQVDFATECSSALLVCMFVYLRLWLKELKKPNLASNIAACALTLTFMYFFPAFLVFKHLYCPRKQSESPI